MIVPKRIVCLAGTLLTLLALPTFAEAKSYSLPQASYTMRVQEDGSAKVVERITFDFDGNFHGVYRDIPTPPGAEIGSVKVSDQDGAYTLGGPSQIGQDGPVQTFNTAYLGDRLRIVLHIDAADEQRTFTISYRWRRVVKVYDDVADLFIKTWGDQWPVSLGQLDAKIVLPGSVKASNPLYRAWGVPYFLDGNVRRTPTSVINRITDIPENQYAELRVTFPSSLLSSTDGALRLSGDGLQSILAAQREDFRQYSHDQAKVKNYEKHPEKIVVIALLGGLLPATLLVFALYMFFGRGGNPEIEYEREPPSDLSPALVSAYVSENAVAAHGQQMLAVIFDLIQRGYFSSLPVPKADGEGSDLMIKPAGQERDRSSLTSFELLVADLLDRALRENGGEVRLAELPAAMKDLTGVETSYQQFKDEIANGAAGLQRLTHTGNRVRWGIFAVTLVITIICGVIFFGGLDDPPLDWNSLKFGLVGLCALIWTAILLLTPRSVFVRRAREDRELAARWTAFRRFLQDFPRMQDVPTIGLPMWERLLVYGIGFGLANQVLEAARINLASEVWAESSIYGGLGYWYGGSFYWGTVGAFDLGSELDSAMTPATDTTSGFGGSMGGFGGGGAGGGGGGAW